MTAIKNILLACLFLVWFFPVQASETIMVPDNSPLFKWENQKWTIKAVAQRGFQAEIIKKEKIFLSHDRVIGLFTDVYYLKIPGTDGLSYFPKITFKKGKDGKIIHEAEQIDSLMFLGTIIFLLGLLALAGYFRLESEKKNYLLPTALVFFAWGFAAWYIGFISDLIVAPSDDIAFFNIAKTILAGDFTSVKYVYPVGFPLLCIPFILLFNLQNWIDFMLVFMNYQTFVLIPGMFLILYRFFYAKMGFSRIQSFCILFLWLILLSCYLPISFLPSSDTPLYIPETYLNNACFSLPERHSFLFVKCTLLGRNAMSDYTAALLLAVLLYFSMKKSQSLIRFFVLSMVFGFLCLVRLNYIFFAPLLALVFYDSFSELWKMKRNYLYAALCGTAGFMIFFICQCVINKIQLGSPFVWPYSLHEYRPDRGFVWNVVPYGFKFLCQNNYIYIVLGLSSLLFIPDRKTRAILTLWSLPMLLFFCGYPFVFHSSVRFIFALYPPLLAAMVMNPVWKASWSVRLKAALVVISSCVLCKSNLFFIYIQPWNLGKYGIPNRVFIISQCVICLFCCAVIFSMRKELKTDYANTIRHVRFLILFTAVPLSRINMEALQVHSVGPYSL